MAKRETPPLGPDKPLNTPVKIYTATVISVDTSTYEMRVFAGINGGPSEPIEIPSPYFNARDGSGSGMHILPEVGAEVWIAETSDGKKLPISYHGAIAESFRNGRPEGVEGDILLGTTDDNFIGVLRGGSIVLEAGALCKVLMDPFSDTVSFISSNLETYTVPYSEEHICEESRECSSLYRYFKKAEDTFPTVEVRYGSGSKVFTFTVRSSKTTKSFTSSLSLSGESEIKLKNATVDVSQDVRIGKSNVTSLVKSDTFLQDLSEALSEINKIISQIKPVIDPVLATQGIFPGTAVYNTLVPSPTPLTSMITKINTGSYETTKLKSE